MKLRKIIYYDGIHYNKPIIIDDENYIYKEIQKRVSGFYYTTAEKTKYQFLVSDEKLLTIEEVEYDIEGCEVEIKAIGLMKKFCPSYDTPKTMTEVREILFSVINNIEPSIKTRLKWEKEEHNTLILIIMMVGLVVMPFVITLARESFFLMLLIGFIATLIRKDETSVLTFISQLILLGFMVWTGFEKNIEQNILSCVNVISLYMLQNLLLNRKID